MESASTSDWLGSYPDAMMCRGRVARGMRTESLFMACADAGERFNKDNGGYRTGGRLDDP